MIFFGVQIYTCMLNTLSHIIYILFDIVYDFSMIDKSLFVCFGINSCSDMTFPRTSCGSIK